MDLLAKKGEVLGARIVERRARLLCRVMLQEFCSFRSSVVRICPEVGKEWRGRGGRRSWGTEEEQGGQESGSVRGFFLVRRSDERISQKHF